MDQRCASEPVRDGYQHIWHSGKVYQTANIDGLEVRDGSRIGIDQIRRAVAVDIGPTDNCVRPNGLRHVGNDFLSTESIVAQVEPVPELSWSRPFNHEICQAVAVDVRQLGSSDLEIVQYNTGNWDVNRLGEAPVTQP